MTRTVADCTPAEAVSALGFMLSWHWRAQRDGHLPLRVEGPGGSLRLLSLGMGSTLRMLPRRCEVLDERFSRQLSLGVPHRINDVVWASTVLHCWVSGAEQVSKASRMTVLPSMVLRGSGSRRLLLWALNESIDSDLARKLNRRLAYACGAEQKTVEPGNLWAPVPGSYERVGRKVPVRIDVTRLSTDDFSAGQVAGGLREAPDRNAWREREALRKRLRSG